MKAVDKADSSNEAVDATEANKADEAIMPAEANEANKADKLLSQQGWWANEASLANDVDDAEVAESNDADVTTMPAKANEADAEADEANKAIVAV